VAVLAVGREVEIAPAIDLPAPRDGTSADLAAPDPVEGLVLVGDVGVIAVIHEELRGPLVAGIATALHRLVPLERAPIAVARKWTSQGCTCST
jgi:hypothetical protein